MRKRLAMAGLINVLILPAVTAGDLEALDQFTAVQQDQLTLIILVLEFLGELD